MPFSVVRLGSDRLPEEGLRLGTVRRPPRGVRKTDYARRNFYDLWVPELAPSAELLARVRADPAAVGSWLRFERSYRREMARPPAKRLIGLLAALSHASSFSVGCYCEDESRCHRSVLRALLVEAGGASTD